MNDRRGRWEYYDNLAQAKLAAQKPYWFRVQYVSFNEPGWYWVETYDQPCPRGCCRDSVIRIVPAAARLAEIRDDMIELASELRLAREKAVG